MKPLITSILALLGTASLASATLVNVDFNLSTGTAGTFSGAAVLGSVGDTWTSVTRPGGAGTAFSGISLLTSSNTASGLSLSVTAFQGAFDLSATAPYNGQVDASVKPLMLDYLSLYSGSPSSATITLSGFTPSSSVDIILFSANSAGQGATFQLKDSLGNLVGTAKTASDTGNIGATLIDGDEYVRFNGVTTSPTGDVTIAWNVASGKTFGALNGMQIQFVPEPTTATLGFVGLAGLLGLRRRRS